MPAPALAQTGATYHVDPAGVAGACSDSRPAVHARSPLTPWCTVDRAAAAAPADSVALVRRASIAQITIDGKRRAGNLTVRPFPGEVVQISDIDIENSSGVTFDGFAISDPPQVLAGAQNVGFTNGTLAGGIKLAAGSGPVYIAGNRISNPSGYGMNFSAGAGDAPIVDVTVRGNLFDGIAVDAIQAKNFRNLLIVGNEFRNVKATDSSAHPDVLQTVFGGRNLVFRNNWVHDYEAQGFFIADGTVTSVVVENNLIEDSIGPMSPVRIADAVGVSFVNNTVRGLARFSAGTRNAVIRNNIIEQLELDRSEGLTIDYEDYNLIESGPRAGAHDRTGAPRFVNEAAGDFELLAGSPAVDAGTSDGAPALDMRGRLRVDDIASANVVGKHDMGALERGGRLPGRRFRIRPRVRAAGARRLKVTVRCPRACRVAVAVKVKRKVARRLRLRPRGRVVLGRAPRSSRRAGRVRLTVRFDRRTVRALKRARRVPLILKVTGTTRSGAKHSLRRTVRVKTR
jgi:hypothetical protein